MKAIRPLFSPLISVHQNQSQSVFSQGLELSANDIRKEEHLKDFPGASLVIVETSSVS